MEGSVLGYVLCVVFAALCGYLLGSLNGAIVSVRLLKHVDVRDYGSHNAGLTNTLRCFGKGCGILTMVIDLGKGAAAMALAQAVGTWLAWAPIAEGNDAGRDYRWMCYVAMVFAILGHVFPLYHRFRGGKGVLVGVSVFLVINPVLFLVLMAIFSLLLWLTKYVSFASCTATVTAIPITFFVEWLLRDTRMEVVVLYTALVTVAVITILYSHRENIHRLRAGTERRIGDKKKPETDTN